MPTCVYNSNDYVLINVKKQKKLYPVVGAFLTWRAINNMNILHIIHYQYQYISIHVNLNYIFLLQSPELQTLLHSFPQLETHKLNVSFLSSDAIHWACSYGVEPDIENNTVKRVSCA